MNTATSSAQITTAALFLAATSLAQSTTLISQSSSGVQGNQYSEAPSISGDGRLVAFQSSSSTLVVGDNNNHDDIFVRDRALATTARVSVTSTGAEANGVSYASSISGDGRFVVFLSGATNLVTSDTNSTSDVFVHELSSGVTTRVSVGNADLQSNGPSYSASISIDGRHVAFHSAATNLVLGDTNSSWDVFVHDRQTATTIRASVSASGAQAVGHCAAPSLSGDGRFVAFHSNASNLVSGDTNGAWDIFVRDLVGNTTTRASLNTSGVQGNGGCADASLSADGRFVVFTSSATNLIASDTNSRDDVFLHDRDLSVTTRVSEATGGLQADDASRRAHLSTDGRFVVFESLAQNLDASDNNVAWDVFVRNRFSGETTRVSINDLGVEGDSSSSAGSISAYGRFVAFQSYGSNLVPNDMNNNGDVFARDRGTEAPTAYCTAGTTTIGCVPVISATGFPSASATSGFTLHAQTLEGQRSGLFFYGTSGASEWPWSAASSSFLCVKTPTQRLPLANSGGTSGTCTGAFSADFLAFMAANPGALGQPLVPGSIFYTQAWFRDPPAPKATNLTGGLMFTLEP